MSRESARTASFTEWLLDDPAVEIAATDPDSFRAGISLYRRRPDKTYSLTDCLSMLVMRALELDEVLTTDRHFAQEGFQTILAQ